MTLKRVQLISCAVLLLAISGCVKETVQGNRITFTYQLWVPLMLTLGGIAAAVGGWYFRKSSQRFAWVALILGPLLVLFVGPQYFMDRATVDADGFFSRQGIVGIAHVHHVRFDDLKEIQITSEVSTGRRGRKNVNYFLNCNRKDGSTEKIGISSEMSKSAVPYVLHIAREREIPVLDKTGGG